MYLFCKHYLKQCRSLIYWYPYDPLKIDVEHFLFYFILIFIHSFE